MDRALLAELITLLVLTTLLIGLIPVIPVNAIALDDLGTPDVQKGDKIYVSGTLATPGATVNVYWDNAMKETYSGGEGKIASGKAKGSGNYNISVTIPEAVSGAHYIIVRDTSTGEVVGGTEGMVTVIPKLVTDPKSGLKDDTITLKGYGFDYNSDDDKGIEVNVTFAPTGPGGAQLADNATTLPKTNSLGTFTYNFKIKAVDYATNYTIIVCYWRRYY